MTIRNLDVAFNPSSVAVIGASERVGSLGRVLAKNLRRDFAGRVLLVNPKYRRLFDTEVYADVADLPIAPDLAVIATPPRTVPGLLDVLGRMGTRAACIISAGFESARQGGELRQGMLDAARPYLIRIIGPNCLGVQVPGRGLNASFAHLSALPGSIAFVAQSGAMIAAVLDWAQPRGIGFSHLVSLGDMLDVDFGDMLDYLANAAGTSAILLYIEAITDARKFMSAARAAARSKPVIVVKVGRHAAAARAAAAHTGALAGQDAVYDAAFRRAGMLRVNSLEDLFNAVETLATMHPPEGNRLAILTNGGGIGVLATDALITEHGRLAELSPASIDRLDAVLPEAWSRGNPVDIVGDATGERYVAALRILMQDADSDGVLILNCPTAVASSDDAANAIVEALPALPAGTVLTSWVGEYSAGGARRRLREHRVPTYDSPEDAVRAFVQAAVFRENQRLLMETPPSLPEQFEPARERAQQLIESALRSGSGWLSAIDAMRVLDAYGIPTVRTEFAGTPEDVAAAASRLGGPVVIKIVSPDITHKSDLGGVQLGVDAADAGTAAAAMHERIRSASPEARIQGFLVQPMARRPHARELIAGMSNDRQFGPVMLFGHGGTAVEVIDDTALALPPLNLKLARELMSRTRVFRLLEGYRDVPRAALDTLALTLVRLSHLVVDCPQLEALDINPLLADAGGVLALDARMQLRATTLEGAERLSVRPYPKELEERIELDDGRVLLLRPIVPEDEPALRDAFGKLSSEEIRFRFFMPLKFLDHVMAARFTQIDYDRQMALVLTDYGIPGKTGIYGVVRLNEDPDRARAEFAVVVLRELTGRGLGKHLVNRIIAYAEGRGIGEIHGDVLADNTRMLNLCRTLGFAVSRDATQRGVLRVSRKFRTE